MAPSLLDTDTLSGIMRQNPLVLANARAYLAIHSRFTLSLVTRYEVLRGLKVKQATAQQAAFEQFCAANIVLPLTDNIIFRAADIYADLHRHGALIGDADILIAATALEHGLVLITNNTNHFNRIAGLPLQNWLAP
jgi:tRNA(fMet)-specific endonuclease VapC